MLSPSASASSEQQPPPFSVEIQAVPRTETATGYVITLKNNVEALQKVVVTQRFSQSPQEAVASDEGLVSPDGIAWTLELQPKQPRAISSEALFNGEVLSRSTICMTDPTTGRLLDCTSGDLMGADEGGGIQWGVWLAALLFLAALAGMGYLVYRLRARWWPPLVKFAGERRSGLAVVVAGVVLIGLAAGLFAVVLDRARDAVGGDGANGAMGWTGEQGHLKVGLPAATKTTEFTVYQWTCAGEEAVQCTAIVAARNISAVPQSWFRRMQRLHHSADAWSEPDVDATVAANGGTDLFASPLAPSERRLAVIVYKPADPKALTRLELREGAFSRGVSLELR
ncbi:MAG TPA: hypothetical protein DGT23_19080 [Micromonosporaceae bacterium]|nr:hypothetical protein [Micromonosporaceae bacterium]